MDFYKEVPDSTEQIEVKEVTVHAHLNRPFSPKNARTSSNQPSLCGPFRSPVSTKVTVQQALVRIGAKERFMVFLGILWKLDVISFAMIDCGFELS